MLQLCKNLKEKITLSVVPHLWGLCFLPLWWRQMAWAGCSGMVPQSASLSSLPGSETRTLHFIITTLCCPETRTLHFIITTLCCPETRTLHFIITTLCCPETRTLHFIITTLCCPETRTLHFIITNCTALWLFSNINLSYNCLLNVTEHDVVSDQCDRAWWCQWSMWQNMMVSLSNVTEHDGVSDQCDRTWWCQCSVR